MEETEVPGENHRPVASYWQNLSHNVASSTLPLAWFELTMLVVISTHCTGSCQSNYHTNTTTPSHIWVATTESVLFLKSLNCDGQQFHKYQQNVPPLTFNSLNTKKDNDRRLSNSGPGLGQAQNMAGLNQLMRP